MEKSIYNSENATLKYVELEEDDITIIEYEVELNDNGDFIGGDFIFEKEEALPAYNCSNSDELIECCRQLIKGETDVKQMWERIKNNFETHNIEVSTDEYEGGNNFMTNI